MTTKSLCEKFYKENKPRGFDPNYPEKVINLINHGEISHRDYIVANLIQGEDNIKEGEFRFKYFECAPPLFSIPRVIEDAEKQGIKIQKSEEILKKVEKLFELISSEETDFSEKYDSEIDKLANELAKIAEGI